MAMTNLLMLTWSVLYLVLPQLPLMVVSLSAVRPTRIIASPSYHDVNLALDYLGDVLMSDSKEECQAIVRQVDLDHEKDVESSGFSLEKQQGDNHNKVPSFERILVQGRPLAIRSTEALLSTDQRRGILQAAEKHWMDRIALGGRTSSSRFTIQRPGNYELHTADLGLCDSMINPLLQLQIYPWLREAFSFHSNASLCVYDSLVIRYNSTEAKRHHQDDHKGASQPLHRDLGIFSVNIQLSDPDLFEGGGTFFEHQLLLEDDATLNHHSAAEVPAPQPLRPCQAGGALAHRSNERHAGAVTTDGVRDILVFFIMSTKASTLRGQRLKNCFPHFGQEHGHDIIFWRIQHHYLAARADPDDGEALLYIATALLEWTKTMPSLHQQESLLQIAMHCLSGASDLCPCDARVWNNFGLTTGRLVHQHGRTELTTQAEMAYKTCLTLLHRTSQAGCGEISLDIDACRLNFGLFISNLDRFDQAAELLEPLAAKESLFSSSASHHDTRHYNQHLLASQAQILFRYCVERQSQVR